MRATKDALRRSRGLLEKRHALAHLIPRGAGLTGESQTQRALRRWWLGFKLAYQGFRDSRALGPLFGLRR